MVLIHECDDQAGAVVVWRLLPDDAERPESRQGLRPAGRRVAPGDGREDDAAAVVGRRPDGGERWELREHLRVVGTRVTRRALSRVLRVRPDPNTLLDASGELELDHRPGALPPIESRRLGDQVPASRSAI